MAFSVPLIRKKKKTDKRKVVSEDNILYKRKEPQINFFGYKYGNSKEGDTVALFWKDKFVQGVIYKRTKDSAGVIILEENSQELVWVPWHTIRIPKCEARSYNDCNMYQLKRMCFEKHLGTSGLKKDLIDRLRKKINVKEFSHIESLLNLPLHEAKAQFCSVLAKNKCKYPDVRRRIIGKFFQNKYGKITAKNCTSLLTKRRFAILLGLYDKYFFNNMLIDKFDFKVPIKWKKNLKDANAITYYYPKSKRVEICLNGPKLKQIEDISEDKYFVESSVEITDFITLIQVIVEHELVHAFLRTYCLPYARKNTDMEQSWNFYDYNAASGHTNLFMSIVYNTFSHTDFTSLPMSKKSKLKTKLGQPDYHKIAKEGDMVYFYTEKEGNTIIQTGTLISKGNKKKCKVLVHDTENTIKLKYSRITQIKGPLCSYLSKTNKSNIV